MLSATNGLESVKTSSHREHDKKQQIMPGGCYPKDYLEQQKENQKKEIPLFDRCTTPVGILLIIILFYGMLNP